MQRLKSIPLLCKLCIYKAESICVLLTNWVLLRITYMFIKLKLFHTKANKCVAPNVANVIKTRQRSPTKFADNEFGGKDFGSVFEWMGLSVAALGKFIIFLNVVESRVGEGESERVAWLAAGGEKSLSLWLEVCHFGWAGCISAGCRRGSAGESRYVWMFYAGGLM